MVVSGSSAAGRAVVPEDGTSTELNRAFVSPGYRVAARPLSRKLSDGHLVACHWAEDIKAGRIAPQEREAIFQAGDGKPPEEPAPV